jgi:hypothetical protein
VVQTQRTATLRHLRDLTGLKRESLGRAEAAAEGHVNGEARAGADQGLAWQLVLENLVFAAEAEVRWLDHVETMLARRPGATASDHTGAPTTATRHPPDVVSTTAPGGNHA